MCSLPGSNAEDRDLRNECVRVVNEISAHVKDAEPCHVLEASFTIAHMNICTKDDITMCVRLTVRGFEIVGNKYDTDCIPPTNTYESIDQLLNDVSPAYRESFCQSLFSKLENLQQGE